jgi:hypothetical protein
MPLVVLYALGGSALLVSGGFFADKTGEGVNDASTAAIKFAVAAGISYVIAKRLKVI